MVETFFRESLNYCSEISFKECTFMIYFIRTFSYISLAFLLFFTLERYWKLTKDIRKYEALMRDSRFRTVVALIWIGFITFSTALTPDWKRLFGKERNSTSVDICIFSKSMEPHIGFVTSFISQFLPLTSIVAINCILGVKIRRILQQNQQKLNLSEEQQLKNENIIKKVEFNLFVMSNLIAFLNLPIIVLNSFDLIQFAHLIGAPPVEIPITVIRFFLFFASMYPFAEALICLILNQDFKGLLLEKWQIIMIKANLSKSEQSTSN
ncbi:hypothetical protein RF11_11996 [Thelohanellus kitauei]|uniref:G-protein coupled receptors family 1 profile domain-containing protein n=1 Tax=Thelohanellus kitauei TaxID=669202 RepID=A0A0C2JAN1_THEKT|nr:hypothetical protein RF11_11996 [Thelohanellus kitauei]